MLHGPTGQSFFLKEILVSKYFHEYGILPEACYDEFSCHARCTGANKYLANLNLKVTDYYYVGGYYGGSNEDNMLEELKKNGPFVVSMKVSVEFYSYHSGIFTKAKMINKKKKEWQNVNHSVLLVGYGVDNGVEYWHVMDSWSTKWGDKGFVKIKKGDNIMSIGSMGEAATVEINEIVKHK